MANIKPSDAVAWVRVRILIMQNNAEMVKKLLQIVNLAIIPPISYFSHRQRPNSRDRRALSITNKSDHLVCEFEPVSEDGGIFQ